MTRKRPTDYMRESGGSFTIKSQDDGTPISELLTLNDGLLLLTQKAIYEVKLADQIDPKRENPNIPPIVQRRILDIGTDSELVGRVLLTARKLFRKEFLPRSIDLTQAMTLAYEALMDIVAMQSTSDDYMLAEKRAIEVAEQSGASTIPCIGNVQSSLQIIFPASRPCCAINAGYYETILSRPWVEMELWFIARFFKSQVWGA